MICRDLALEALCPLAQVDRKKADPFFLGPHAIFLIPDWLLGAASFPYRILGERAEVEFYLGV